MDQMAPEPRRSARILSMSHGRIELLNRQSAYDCMIADISVGGARVIIENAAMLPDEFLLEVPSKGLRKRATVRWRQASELSRFPRPGQRIGSVIHFSR